MSYKFENEVDYNVIIHIGEKHNFKEYHAYFNILYYRSEYFNKALSEKTSRKQMENI
jgi:hypothetical protein